MPYRSAFHSNTLPAISSTPNGLPPAGKLPTGAVDTQPSSISYIAFGLTFKSKSCDILFRTGFCTPRHSAPHAFSRLALGSWSPHGYIRPSLPRAAYSHSASVGNRFPAHVQYATAWFQSTQLIGWSGRLLALQELLHS